VIYTDAVRAWLLCAAVVFVLCAWPLLLVEVPPYQDIGNHLAVATIIDHPSDYPEFVFNGFFKTNAALFAWEHFVGHALSSTLGAIRAFAAVVLAANALAFTRLLLVARGRAAMITGTLVLAPIVHNFCLCLGMLDFCLGLAVAVFLIALLVEQRGAPTAKRAALIAATSILAWYTHLIPLFFVLLLVLVEIVVAMFRARGDLQKLFARAVLPLAPGALLLAWSVLGQLFARSSVAMTSYASIWLAPWDLVANLWVQWFLAFTPRSIASLAPCLVIAFFAWKNRAVRTPFLSSAAMLAFGALYAFVPYVLSFWAFANTRAAAILWTIALVRLPERFPKWLVGTLAACSVAYSISLGVDYVRLDRDHQEIVSGIDAVPERAALLPLVFETKGASVNTRPLSHAWGFYVNAKHTSAPLVFATSRMFGVAYREPPDPRLEHVGFEHFVGLMRDPSWICATLKTSTCVDTWRAAWSDFFAHVEPRFDWLLVWDAPAITLGVIPPEYREVFHNGRLRILHRL